MESLKIELRFLSDFRVGTGQGLAGVLDDTVVKNHAGIPYLPGKTIKGVLRNNCRELSLMTGQTLPDESKPDEDKNSPLARIFGTAFLPAAFRFPSAYLSNESMYESIRDNITHGEWHNQIEASSGTAKKKHLFSYETASRELSFPFTITETISEGTNPEDIDRALLIATLLFTDHIGGKRKRGRGKCRFSFAQDSWHNKTPDNWLTLLLGE